MAESTLVGVPFYENEGQECLNITVRNIDQCLSSLAIDASILVQVNGPETASGKPHQLEIDSSQFNASIELVASKKLSQARAMDDIIHAAAQRNINRIFLTDADIYRFTDSLRKMWEFDEPKTVIGARYRPYPIEIVEAEFGTLTYEERLLYQIFDGDQSPQVRHTLNRRGMDRKEWVKASLMLVDVQASIGMHSTQNQATDSIMNRRLEADDIGIASDAYFMHMGRTDMTDHFKARLRHFRAAASLGELEHFLHKEIQLPPVETMNEIANEIRHSYVMGDFYAMLYLCRCAIRQHVNEICMKIAKGTWTEQDIPQAKKISLMDVRTYHDARSAVLRFFEDIDWDSIQGFAINAPATTQERLRQPFDMTRHLANYELAKTAISTFMTDEPMGFKR